MAEEFLPEEHLPDDHLPPDFLPEGGPAAGNPPVNVAIPSISAAHRVTEVPFSDDGTWEGDDVIVYTYQWQIADPILEEGVPIYDDGEIVVDEPWEDIVGETNDTYTIDVADIGRVIRLEVTATNDAGSAVEYSMASEIILPALVGTDVGGWGMIHGMIRGGLLVGEGEDD